MFYLNVDTHAGKILERYIGEDGEEHMRKVSFEPKFFHHAPDGEYKDIHGKPVREKVFKSISSSREWRKSMRTQMREALGMDDYNIQYIAETYPDDIEFDSSKIRIAWIDLEVESEEGFPEPALAKYEIEVAAHYDTIEDTYYVFSTKSWEESQSELRKDLLDRVEFKQYDTESKMLIGYMKFWCGHYPNVLTGWNTETFDIPYLVNRIDKLFGDGIAKKLSPWGVLKTKTFTDNYHNEQITYTFLGISCMDYMAVYKKFELSPRRSMKLDYIGEVELGRKKLHYDGPLWKLAKEDPQKYVDYNITDVELLVEIDKKKALFELAFELAYYAKCNHSDVLGTIKTWDAILYNSLNSKGIAVPENRNSAKEPFEGAFVKAPITGMYDWLMSFDLTSLYPHVIMQWNISPETLVAQDEEYPDIKQFAHKLVDIENTQYAYNPSGCHYRKDIKGIIPEEIEKVFNQRKHHKGIEFEASKQAEQCKKDGDMEGYEKYKAIESKEYISQWSRKILINGLYGAQGNVYFRYYRIENALSTTQGAQLAIRWIERKLNEYMNKVCSTNDVDYIKYIDTDSVYIHFEPMLESLLAKKGMDINDLEDIQVVNLLDKIGKTKIEPFIKEAYIEMAEYVNAYEQKMFMDREAIASRGFWTAKKRYAMWVWDNEGKRKFNEDGSVKPVLKVTGLESVKGGTAEACRTAFEDCYKIILTQSNKELTQYIENFEDGFKNRDYMNISYVQGVNDIEKYEDGRGFPKKGATAQVKAAMVFNRMAKEYPTVAPIRSGDKISIAYIKTPNPWGNDRIGWPSGDYMPSDFDLDMDKLLDRNRAFQANFLDPIETICKEIGWKAEYTGESLGDLFDI